MKRLFLTKKNIQSPFFLLPFLFSWGIYFPILGQKHDFEKLIKKESYAEVIHILNKKTQLNTQEQFYLAIAQLQSHEIHQAKKLLEALHHKSDSLPDFEFWYGKCAYWLQDFDSALFFLEKSKSKKYQIQLQELRQFCLNALAIKEQKNEYTVKNLEIINTEKSEFGALATRDFQKIIFTRQQTPLSPLPKNTFNEEAKQIMIAQQNTDGNWQKPTRINNSETSSGMDAAVQLLDADRKMLIYQDGDLKVSEYINGEWKIPQLLQDGINSTEIEKYACIFEQGKRIIFSSNHEGKLRSLDLYEAQLLPNQKWGQPQPLRELNTNFDEDTPFIADNGNTLYFCSKGHNSVGGYDIFRSSYDSVAKKWSAPQNMGFPINSVYDDSFLFLQNQVGYLTSNRNGGKGLEDIYEVFLFSKIQLNGKVINKKNLKPENCQLVFSNQYEKFSVYTSDDGFYEIALPFYKKLKLNIIKDDFILYEEDIYLKPNPKRPHVQSHNYYLSYDSLPASTRHLSTWGIIKDKKTNRGIFANINLLKNNTIIQKIQTDTLGKYQWEILKAKGSYQMDISAKGYLYESTAVGADLKGKVELNIRLKPFEKNMVFVLKQLYFDSNSDSIRPESEYALAKLLKFMQQNENLKIEISGHTDNIGDATRNKILSEKRAKSVANYLIINGIDAKRIQTLGYGDTRPIASNDDEEDGRELNRRIEIKILEW